MICKYEDVLSYLQTLQECQFEKQNCNLSGISTLSFGIPQAFREIYDISDF